MPFREFCHSASLLATAPGSYLGLTRPGSCLNERWRSQNFTFNGHWDKNSTYRITNQIWYNLDLWRLRLFYSKCCGVSGIGQLSRLLDLMHQEWQQTDIYWRTALQYRYFYCECFCFVLLSEGNLALLTKPQLWFVFYDFVNYDSTNKTYWSTYRI